MDDSRIHVSYRQGLKPLEDLLKNVRRPGDFFVHGLLEVPMPRMEVEGAGLVSFPVPDTQISSLVQQAVRAPYGRGGDTILDPAVRKVWQIAASRVQIGGKSWERTLQHILALVAEGLGCEGAKVSAELYKLLVYDPGAFFKAHRDTEKTEGMFGTLVIALPAPHRGGELVIRHAGREVSVDLSGGDVSELSFAAFYADCEHEVRPILEGHRVCLIYNLLQVRSTQTDGRLLLAPLYDAEANTAAGLLEQAFAASDAPAKIAWLLEHQYSPAELAFATLKHADAARAKILRQVAARADCVLHLGIVHIEETGAAQPDYDAYASRRGRGRYHSHDDEDDVEEDVSSDDFEVIEVSDGSQYVDHWKTADDQPAGYGRVPLDDGEVLPAGALDGEDPDEQRLMEATGNEGASFERSYHRAALVIWRRDRFADVLLQGGVGAVLPWFRERVAAASEPTTPESERAAVRATARRIVQAWADGPDYRLVVDSTPPPDRGEMIALLGRVADPALLIEFVDTVVIPLFDGSEIEAMAATLRLRGADSAAEQCSRLVRHNVRWFPAACVDLLTRLCHAPETGASPDWAEAGRQVAATIVENLSLIESFETARAQVGWMRGKHVQPMQARVLADLFTALAPLAARDLENAAVIAVCATPSIFDPRAVIVPALATLSERHVRGAADDEVWQQLWRHAADFLLNRSEIPPTPPQDWRQDVTTSCTCEDCRELREFARDPAAQVHRFRVRRDRREHLHHAIEHLQLDMTHLTERKGSPQTLVCTKTRGRHERRCREHRDDLAALKQLAALVNEPAAGPLAVLCRRIADAHTASASR